MKRYITPCLFALLPLSVQFPLQAQSSDPAPRPSSEEGKSDPKTEAEEKIEIIAKRLSIEPSSTTFLSKEKLDVYKSTDLIRALKSVPGIQMQEEDGYGLRPNIGMRGAHPHRSKKILLMEDGIPSGPAPYSAPAAYYVPNMSLIEAIEVNKGSAAVRYGPQTIGGSINLLTASIPDEDLLSTVDLAAGSYDFRKAILSNGGNYGRWGWLLLGSDVGTSGYKTLSGGGKTGFHKQDLLGKLSYRLSDRQSLELKLGWSNEYSAESYLGISPDDFKSDPYQRYAASQRDAMENSHRTLALSYRFKGDSFSHSITAYQRAFDRNWSRLNGFSNPLTDTRGVVNEPFGANQHAFDVLRGTDDTLGQDDQLVIANNHRIFYSRGLNWQAKHETDLAAGLRNEAEFGLRYHEDGIRRDHTTDTFAMRNGIMEPTGDPRKTAAQNKNEAKATAAFVWNTLHVNDWSLSAGIRQEWVRYQATNLNPPNDRSKFEKTASMPGAGVFYRITPEIAWLLGAYRGIGLSAGDGSQNAKPEESINYESGFRWLRPGSRANLIGFWNDYKNIQGTCSFSEGCSEAELDKVFDGGKAKIYGFESDLSHRFQLAPLAFPFQFQYTMTRASFDTNFTSALPDWGVGQVHRGDPLPYISRHQATIGAGVEWRDIAFHALWNWRGKSYDQAVAEGRLEIPDSRIVDLSLRYHFMERFELYSNVDNVFKEKTIASYRPFGARPGKAQSLTFGVKGAF